MDVPLLPSSTELERSLGKAELFILGLRLVVRVKEISEVRSATFAGPSSEDVPVASAFVAERVCLVIVFISGDSLLIGGTSIDVRVFVPRALRRPWREPTSFDLRAAFSKALDFPISLLLITSASALLIEERVIECRTLVGCFAGRAAPLAIAESAEGMVGSSMKQRS
jgi:hypothetical protein